jgi:hypothetical protein
MRPASSKSKLKNYLQVEESSRTGEKPDLIVLDGCAILWTINWPISGTLLDLVNAVAAYVHARLMNCDVHLIFDRYLDYSTKGCTRGRRASVTADHRHHFILQSPLPPQCMSHHSALSLTTKCSYLTSYVTTCQPTFRSISATINLSSLVLMTLPWDYISRDITWLTVMRRRTSSSSIKWCRQPDRITKPVTIAQMSLYYWYISTKHWTIPVNYLITSSKARNVANIGTTVRKHHQEIVPHVLPLHALTSWLAATPSAQFMVSGK